MRRIAFVALALLAALADAATAQLTAASSSNRWVPSRGGAGQNSSGASYGYSDCISEDAVGLVAGGQIAWLQGFDTEDVAGPFDEISRMAVANGTTTAAGASAGSIGRGYIYDDPNGDFTDPQDLTLADLVTSGAWTTCCPGTDTKEEIAMTPGAVSGGFWAVAMMTHQPGEYPAAFDEGEPSAGRSWIAGSVTTFDPADICAGIGCFEMAGLGFDSVFLMTVESSGATQPCEFYTDRADFDCAAPGVASYDFANMAPAPGEFSCCSPGRFSNTTNNGCFKPGAFPATLVFESLQDSAGACAINEGAFGFGRPSIGCNGFDDDDVFVFNPPVLAFGVDVTGFSGPLTPMRAELFDASDKLVCAQSGIGPGFFGFSSSIPIARIELRDVDSGTSTSAAFYSDVRWGDPAGAPTTVYCTAKTGLVCGTPNVSFLGEPSACDTNGFTISAFPARANKAGRILYSCDGPAAVPFQGGFLCVAATIRRTPSVTSGGGPACSGLFQLDFNRFASGNGGGNPDPCLSIPGQFVWAQWWARDSVATGSFLSAGVAFQM